MMDYIKRNLFTVLLSLLVVLLVASVAFTAYNRKVMIENTVLKKQTELVKAELNNIFDANLRSMDMGLRGYALTQNKQLLDPFFGGITRGEATLATLDSLLAVQNLDTLMPEFAKFKTEHAAFITHSMKMKDLAEQGDIEGFVRLLEIDKGYDLYKVFVPINTKLSRYENNLIEQSQQNYEAAMSRNLYFQIFLVLLGIPTLLTLIIRIRRENRERDQLLQNFASNNEEYLFNAGNSDTKKSAEGIISNSINNLKQASHFIKDVTSGNYAVQWRGLDETNEALNKENLVGHLVNMRDEMKRVKQEDKERMWVTEGLAEFSEIVRNNQKSIASLTDSVVRFLTQYLKAQQGSLFIIKDEEGEASYLVLSSSFAFDKKKYIDKHIEMGSGLIGQACMDGNTVLLTEIPQHYVHITSGLGEATPNCLLIVPMKYNERVECAFEIASFRKFEPFEISFLEKAGEFVASAIASVRLSEDSSNLLRAAQENSEMMRSQEEEMRQNMEELQATQEEMARKEAESAKVLLDSRGNEKVLQDEVRRLKNQLEKDR